MPSYGFARLAKEKKAENAASMPPSKPPESKQLTMGTDEHNSRWCGLKWKLQKLEYGSNCPASFEI